MAMVTGEIGLKKMEEWFDQRRPKKGTAHAMGGGGGAPLPLASRGPRKPCRSSGNEVCGGERCELRAPAGGVGCGEATPTGGGGGGDT